MSANPTLDAYTAKAENTDITPQQKISGLQKIVKESKMAMLTTRSATGELHSRAMHPAAFESESQVNLYFIANNASHKFEEIHNDANVNVSFSDPTSTDWASYAAKARVHQDKDLIHKHWSHRIGAYFGDLKDGIHKGDEHDPRVAIIEIIPEEIRYWVSTHSALSRSINTAVSAAMGRVSVPGEVRTITNAEIKLTQGLHSRSGGA